MCSTCNRISILNFFFQCCLLNYDHEGATRAFGCHLHLVIKSCVPTSRRRDQCQTLAFILLYHAQMSHIFRIYNGDPQNQPNIVCDDFIIFTWHNCGHKGVGRNSRFEALQVELELTVYGTINIHQHINSNFTILCYYWHKGFLPGPWARCALFWVQLPFIHKIMRISIQKTRQVPNFSLYPPLSSPNATYQSFI